MRDPVETLRGLLEMGAEDPQLTSKEARELVDEVERLRAALDEIDGAGAAGGAGDNRPHPNRPVRGVTGAPLETYSKGRLVQMVRKVEAENERMRTAIRRLDGIIEFAEPVVVYNELIELRDLAQRRGGE